MSTRDQYKNDFSRRATQRLLSITKSLNKRNIHDWRRPNVIENAIRLDKTLMFELQKMSKGDWQKMGAFLKVSTHNVRQTLLQLQEMRQQNIDPTHPNVINNPNHPLNPANANAMQLLLQVNPLLNPLFIEYVNSQAAVVEAENEEDTENEEQYDKTMENILAPATVADAAQQELKNNPHLDPYKTLGVDRDAPQEQIQAAILYHSAEYAHEKGAEPSHGFRKVAAAAALIATPTLRKEYDESHQHGLEDTAKLAVMGTPTFTAGVN